MKLLPDNRELGWAPYFWLIYVVGFLGEAFLRPLSLGLRGAAVAGAALFLVLYFRAWWFSGTALLPYVGGILALGVFFIPKVAAANVFFVYAAAFVGAVGPPRVAFRYLFAIVAVALGEAYLMDLPRYAWMPAVFVSLIVGGPNIQFIDAQRTRRRLALAQNEILQLAKVAERERIARDMHDLLGHTLSVIVLKSELASKLMPSDPERAAREIREVEVVSRQALGEVRRAIQGYRSQGLAAELQAVRPALDAAGIVLHAELPTFPMPPAAEGVLALALREAVTNVARHSGARNCWVGLQEGQGAVSLEVRDDGKGGEASFGSGLLGMRERARALGGDVVREASAGTRLVVSLPV